MRIVESKPDHWALLVEEVKWAEKIREVDIAAFGLHLRRFIDVYLDLIYEREYIEQNPGDDSTTFNRINNPRFCKTVNHDVVTLLHTLRIFGNKCVHENLDKQQMELCREGISDYLNYAHGLLNWLSRKYKGQNFDLSVFATGSKHLCLKDLFLDLKLTQDQSTLLECFSQFLVDDDKQIFLLKGSAGTGKTFLLKGIVEYLNITGRNFSLAASTGKAARVLSEKTGFLARTVHSSIYKLEEVENTSVWVLASNTDADNSIFFVDESSMIGDSDLGNEHSPITFGSGKLLSDLLQYMDLPNTHRKIVFVGDSAQLPPVGMSMSPALNKNYLKDQFCCSVEECSLKQVVRQKLSSGILENATHLRDSITNREFTELNISSERDDVEEVQNNNWLDLYLDSCHHKVNGESIVIGYSNAKVCRYNTIIRNYFFPGVRQICPGDKVMVVRNGVIGNKAVFNGEIGLIRQVSPYPDIQRVEIKYTDKKKQFHREVVELRFRDVEVGFRISLKESQFFKTKIIENVLYDDRPNLSHEENLAIWELFKTRHPEQSFSHPYSLELIHLLQSDPYNSALPVKFGYAITGHKSQGSEWKNVFVDANSRKNMLCEDTFRWVYTAITRAKEKLYLIDNPRISFLSNLIPEFDPSVSREQKTENDGPAVVKAIDSGLESGIDPNDTLGNGLFEDIVKILLGSNVKIESKIEYPWVWRYFFTQGTSRARVDFHYNSKQKISSIQSPTHDAFALELLKKFSPILGRLENSQCVNIDVTESNVPAGFHRKLYDSLSKELTDSGVRISDVQSYQWNDRYTFSRDGRSLTMDFYFNGKHQYTHQSIVGKHSANDPIYLAVLTALAKEA